jgi:hypothetical protein
MTSPGIQDTLTARITLIGGEMQNWSDLDTSRGAGPFTSPLVTPMLERLLDGSMTVLVISPTAPWLLEQIADRVGALDILIRSSPDAQTLNLRLTGRPVRIFCGGLDRFTGTPGRYDAVVALDGIPRAYSTDSVFSSWPDTLARLRDLVKPGGRLILGVTNGLGLDRILDAETHIKPPADDLWPTDPGVEPPPGLQAVRDALTTADLATICEYAVYPRPSMPALMIRDQLLTNPLADEVCAVMASATFARTMGGRPVLTDPARLAREVMRHGTGLQLAPGWIFVTEVGRATSTEAMDLPDALMVDSLEHPYWSVVTELALDGGGQWRRSVVEVGRSATDRASGHLLREPGRLPGPLPTGVLLEEKVLTACRYDDLDALRKLVRGYARWLRDQVDAGSATVPGGALFATFENVVADGDRLALLDPSWTTTLEVPFEVAFTRALRRFGFRILSAGLPHPWPSGMSPNRLTVTMASMASVTVTAELLERAALLEVELDGQQRNNTEAEDQLLYFEVETTGEKPMEIEPGQPGGYREALAAVGRLSTELAAAQSQIAWLDQTLQMREGQLRNERKQLSAVRASTSYRTGRAVTAPLRKAVRLFRTPPAKGKA